MSGDMTTEILLQIRDEIRTTNQRLDATRVELSDRIDRLEKRQRESESRLATELVALAGAVREVRDLLKEDRATRDAVQKHDARLAELDQRMTAVERKVG
jgi:DNA repair exonuclease SbcCD nuclease subunit